MLTCSCAIAQVLSYKLTEKVFIKVWLKFSTFYQWEGVKYTVLCNTNDSNTFCKCSFM